MNGPKVLVICTGNAARSVMAAHMLAVLAENEGKVISLRSGGTHAIEGQPMGRRTKDAMVAIDALANVSFGSHRSHQMTQEDVDWAELIIAMEKDHLAYVRRIHPMASSKTAVLTTLVARLEPSPGAFDGRVQQLELSSVEVDSVDEVADPAGGDDAVYVACAAELWELCQEFLNKL